ncbi:MAG: exosortase [Planctomycetota bacterium]|nr:MAG: exosortase [Planctomycetota bacterium]
MAEQSSPQPSLTDTLKKNSDQVVPWAVLVGLMGVLIYTYWNSLDYRGAKQFWDNPKYSHGWLVPIFTVILMWMRYEPFGKVTTTARWAGVGLLAAGLGMRLGATYFPNHVPEMVSFVPSVAGVFLLVGGWQTLRWAGPPIAFLIFMFPLPGFLDARLLAPLQQLATIASTYTLQTMGISAFYEGNRIAINNGEVTLGVVEACSGLRMLTIFVALAVAITLVTERPMWERVVIVLSAVPIALIVNITRITVTAILHLTAGHDLADLVFHDLAGWFMMPMALGLLYVEFQILSHLLIEEGDSGPLQVA